MNHVQFSSQRGTFRAVTHKHGADHEEIIISYYLLNERYVERILFMRQIIEGNCWS